MKKKIIVIFAISLVVLFSLSLVINFLIFPRKYKNYVVAYSDEFGIDKALVYAVIKVESNFEPKAVSKSGALGLMQLLPNTAKWIAEEFGDEYSSELMFEPKFNIRYGCFYLKYLLEKFDDIEVVVCAYNAGEGKVLDWIVNGNIDKNKIDYSETKNYLTKVIGYYKIYKNKLIYM